MFDTVLNIPLHDTSRLDRSSRCVLLWRESVSIVLPVIWNQSKIRKNWHTVFEAFINKNSQYKTQKWCVLWVGDARNILKSFLIQNHF